MRCVAVGALVLSLAAVSACSRPSTNAADYVGEYIFTPGQEPPAEFADVVMLQLDGVAVEIRRSDSKSAPSMTETHWKVQDIPPEPQIVIGDFACTVNTSGRTIRLGINDDLNQYYEKVR